MEIYMDSLIEYSLSDGGYSAYVSVRYVFFVLMSKNRIDATI